MSASGRKAAKGRTPKPTKVKAAPQPLAAGQGSATAPKEGSLTSIAESFNALGAEERLAVLSQMPHGNRSLIERLINKNDGTIDLKAAGGLQEKATFSRDEKADAPTPRAPSNDPWWEKSGAQSPPVNLAAQLHYDVNAATQSLSRAMSRGGNRAATQAARGMTVATPQSPGTAIAVKPKAESAEGALSSFSGNLADRRRGEISDERMKALKTSSVSKSARLSAALESYNASLADQRKSGVPADKAARIASKKLDEAAALVKQHAIEAKDGDPTVVLDIAAALMTLDPDARQTLLRRAGNPELFATLNDSSLPAATLKDGTTALDMAKARSQIEAEDKNAKALQSREGLPLVAKPSSHLRQEGRVTKTGKPKKASQTYKDHLPRNDSPMEVDTSERRAVLEEGGQEALDEVPLNKLESRALKTLAGDQIRQVEAIKRKQRIAAGYTDAIWKALTPDQRADADLRIGVGAYLPDVVKTGEKKLEKLQMAGLRRRPADVLTIGTSQRGGGVAKGASAGWGGSNRQPADRVVDTRNRGYIDRTMSLMYELAQNPTSILDLDKHVPSWRARFGQYDQDGNLHYPANAPNAEFLTQYIQGMFNVGDENFYKTMLPLIERSIAAAPPTPALTLQDGGRIAGGRAAGKQRSAAAYEGEQFVPSPGMAREMQQDGTQIYGDRLLEREELGPPALTPIPQSGLPAPMEGAGRINEGSKSKAREKIDAARKRRQSRGNTDTASIYTVPDNSPVRYLLT